MNHMFKSIAICILLTIPTMALADDPKFDYWPVDLKINGTIIVAGSLSDFDLIKDTLPASKRKQKTTILIDDSTDQETQDSLQSIFGDNKDVGIVKTDGTTKQFESILQGSQCVLWHGTTPLTDSLAKATTGSQSAFAKFIDDGKTLVVVGSPAEIVSEFYLPSTEDQSKDCLLYTSPSPRDATLSRMPSSA